MTPPKTETNLLELMRADRLVQNKRQAEQGAVDREVAREPLPRGQDRARLEATAPWRRIIIKARWRERLFPFAGHQRSAMRCE
jgi:hypothetical protein